MLELIISYPKLSEFYSCKIKFGLEENNVNKN